MSHRIRMLGGCSHPVIICDHCSMPITDASDGNALWLEPMNGRRDGTQYNILHTHKHCNRHFEQMHPPKEGWEWMSHGLTHDLWMLCRSVNFSQQRANKDSILKGWHD